MNEDRGTGDGHQDAARGDPARRAAPSATGVIIARAKAAGGEVVVVKLPVPGPYRAARPDEAAFGSPPGARLAALGVPLHDLGAAPDDPALCFATDHLNREGVGQLCARFLKPILSDDRGKAPRPCPAGSTTAGTIVWRAFPPLPPTPARASLAQREGATGGNS